MNFEKNALLDYTTIKTSKGANGKTLDLNLDLIANNVDVLHKLRGTLSCYCQTKR